MRIYQVGGSVRDQIIGSKIRDIDYVVVGSTPEEMLAKGFKQVGVDFPVYLHPTTKHEHALARTERKSSPGHRGFVVHADPSVTLAEDLGRRDFTVNAMALDADGTLIDPFLGRNDVANRKLRHVSGAFAEDPLRILRAARFASQLQFTVVPETMELMSKMVADGALSELPAERIWMELRRGLEGNIPSFTIRVLRECGALAVLLPEVDALFGVPQPSASHPEGCAGVHTLRVVDACASNWWNDEVRWAALLHDVGKALTSKDKLPYHPGHEEAGAPLARKINDRLKVPRSFARVSEAATRLHGVVHGFDKLDAGGVVDFFNGLAVWRDPDLLKQVLAMTECDFASSPNVPRIYTPHPNRELIEKCLEVGQQTKIDPLQVKEAADPKEFVRRLRIEKIASAL